ncbi:hypothetical protein QNO07_18490 [Streptomyces sp. 549]|uniref:hypothetical protein n=1 Tax=Streptomyces sp. 549 TaxID=3049076 RepID=UPI0024C3DE9B|nr:hypothetical protein [Streptomyces sp. 549]MDK1475383.1 hypothetical protein [Streptomyces sp. 549]
MQRKAYLGGAAAATALAVGLVACTGGGEAAGTGEDAKPGGTSASAPSAKPGTYRTLPDPCDAVPEATLRDLLTPGAADGDDAQTGTPGTGDPALEGEAEPTYDTDRRVSCRWKSPTGLGSHHLTLDFERVVSYDTAVSDDDRAAELYEDRALKDRIPAEAPSPAETGEPEGSGEADEEGGEPETGQSPGAGQGSSTPDASPTGSAGGDSASAPSSDTGVPDPALAPRPLDGIGDSAYLNDVLATADSGVHRDITLVFRSGNVIVTVEYDQWSNDKRRLPDSAELQKKAQKLAEQLAANLAG